MATAQLNRTTFKTSREMDFFSRKELITQTGHDVREWPLVFLKEIIDNSLDACEEAEIPPILEIKANATGISIQDNGPGLPESTLQSAMDFTVRASNREAYVAPDRGAQGNALKTILPMPCVVDPEHGKLIIEAHGKRHGITCGCDPISQMPQIHDDVTLIPTEGTFVRMEWAANRENDGEVLWPFNELRPLAHAWYLQFSKQFFALVESFAIFNPHATIRLNWFGEDWEWTSTAPEWEKWKPNKPTSPSWYQLSHFERLIAAYITHDRERGTDRLVSEFLGEFDGFSGSQKRSKVLTETGLKRSKLSDFVVDGRLDHEQISHLLGAMKRHTKSINPRRLGIIGEDHMRQRLLEMGIEPESFRYAKKLSSSKCKKQQLLQGDKPCFIDDTPWVLESAFGWLGAEAENGRRIFAGANWSAAIKNPFRSFGTTGEGLESALSKMYVSRQEPVVFILHLAHPRLEYTDRGKSALIIGDSDDC